MIKIIITIESNAENTVTSIGLETEMDNPTEMEKEDAQVIGQAILDAAVLHAEKADWHQTLQGKGEGFENVAGIMRKKNGFDS